jgi:hypothetical protein
MRVRHAQPLFALRDFKDTTAKFPDRTVRLGRLLLRFAFAADEGKIMNDMPRFFVLQPADIVSAMPLGRDLRVTPGERSTR